MRVILFILIFVLSQAAVLGQTVDEQVQEIRKEFKSINSRTDYRIDTVDFFDESTEGAELLAYYDSSNQIRKIRVIYFGETGKRVEEFYLQNERLIFVFTQDYRYNRPIYWDEKVAEEMEDNESFDYEKSTIKENRYYLDKNQTLIRWIEENQQMKEDVSVFEKKKEAVIDEFEHLKEKLKNNRG